MCRTRSWVQILSSHNLSVIMTSGMGVGVVFRIGMLRTCLQSPSPWMSGVRWRLLSISLLWVCWDWRGWFACAIALCWNRLSCFLWTWRISSRASWGWTSGPLFFRTRWFGPLFWWSTRLGRIRLAFLAQPFGRPRPNSLWWWEHARHFNECLLTSFAERDIADVPNRVHGVISGFDIIGSLRLS